MSTISASDMLFLLSGGASNSNPSLSLGGAPSSTRVAGNANSLFTDITGDDATAGLTDYRCFYVKNNSSSESLYDASLNIQAQTTGGASLALGVNKTTEVQAIDVEISASSGSVDFKLDDVEFSASWGGSASSFASNLASSMHAAGLYGSSVFLSTSASKYRFIISFLGSLNNRSHPLIELVNNGLSGSPSVSVSRLVAGSPINSVAPTLATPSVAPAGVAFSETSSSSKILVGTLGPGDSMPVWVRRATPANTGFKEFDGATIRLSGNPFGSAFGSSSSG